MLIEKSNCPLARFKCTRSRAKLILKRKITSYSNQGECNNVFNEGRQQLFISILIFQASQKTDFVSDVGDKTAGIEKKSSSLMKKC